MNPKLSVIVPVYNDENYLNKCLDSLICQTYRNMEIVLVDDASVDSSRKICEEYVERYDFVKVIGEEHGGPTHARKAGLNHSCGEYVSFVDGDDYIEPETYAYLMEKIQENDADIGICDMTLVFDNMRVNLSKPLAEGLYDKERLKSEIYPNMLYCEAAGAPLISPSLCNKIFRRNLLTHTLLAADESILYGEDAICAYPCMLDAERVYVTKDKFFYQYVQTRDSASKKYESDLLNKLIPFMTALDKAFEIRNYPEKHLLNDYAALQIIHGIRGELLYDGEAPLRKRIRKVKKELDQPRFDEVFASVRKSGIDKSLRFKLHLAEKRRLFLLYLLFFAKEKALRLRGKAL